MKSDRQKPHHSSCKIAHPGYEEVMSGLEEVIKEQALKKKGKKRKEIKRSKQYWDENKTDPQMHASRQEVFGVWSLLELKLQS